MRPLGKMAVAAFVLSICMIAQQAHANSVIYSGVENIPVPNTSTGLYLDLENGATGTSPFSGWDLNFFTFDYFGTDTLAVDINSSVDQFGSLVADGSGGLALLNAGDSIGAASNLAGGPILAGSPGAWQNVSGGFMGYQFVDSSDQLHYGWLQLDAPGSAGLPATILGWAYDRGSSDILAGQTVPEPSSIALLMTGLIGIGLKRRRMHP